jgi:hypothetical protein
MTDFETEILWPLGIIREIFKTAPIFLKMVVLESPFANNNYSYNFSINAESFSFLFHN